MKPFIPLPALLLSLLASIPLHAGDALHTRGWIGGEFALAKPQRFFVNRDTVQAFPAAYRDEQKAGIFVRSVPAGSPSAMAGLQAGDLILRLDGQVTDHLRTFHKQVETFEPGRTLRLSIWRMGVTNELAVTVGTETYQNVGTLAFGFMWSNQLDLWPNPDFSLFVVGYERATERPQLHSPEADFKRAVAKANAPTDEPSDPAEEEEKQPKAASPPHADGATGNHWRFWALPFSLGFHEKVLSQEGT